LKKIAIYGKGGSGKSTVAAALSVAFARRGLRVLQVGCDPKADSTLTLTGGERIPTLLDLLASGIPRPTPEQFIFPGRLGIDCVEAGGPSPGAGCGGRGIARMFELFKEVRLLATRCYDVVLFDVLGDVVCGGFAAPLRLGFAERAFIVLSEEPLSLFAANNISEAVRTYGLNGVGLGGLILNVSDDVESSGRVSQFAAAIGSEVVGIVPRDRAIQEAERVHLTAAELPAESPTRQAVERLAEAVLATFSAPQKLPCPLPLPELFALLRAPGGFRRPGEGWSGLPTADQARRGGLDSLLGAAGVATASFGPAPLQADRVPGRGGHGQGLPRPPPRALPPDRVVVGGRQAREKMAALLGIGRLRAQALELRRVAWEAGAVAATLSGPATGTFELLFRARGSEEKVYAEIRDFTLSHSSPINAVGRKLVKLVRERLASGPQAWGDLAGLLLDDAEAVVELTDREQKDERKRKVVATPRHWSVWGHESLAGDFFLCQERARQVLGEVRLADDVISIHHGTDACQFSEQATTLASSHFTRFPWAGALHGQERLAGMRSFTTNIREHQLIGGSNEALRRVLDTVAAQGGEAPVSIDVSCCPVVAGEDWQGAIAAFKKRYAGPVIVSEVGGTDLSLEVARIGLAHAGRAASAPEPGTVNLVGFPGTPAIDRLVALLEAVGIRVLQRQLPRVSGKELASFGRAAAQLLWPQVEYELLYRELFEKLPVAAVRIPAPFGITGTRLFIEAAARAAGVDPGAALAALAPHVAAAAARLAPLAARVSTYRLGLALTQQQGPLLERPELVCGVPLQPFLEELGFRVEVLTDSQDERRLEWWLRSGLSALFSDVTYDPRPARAGLAHFGLADLEPGLDGAVRTAERLLRLCDMPFFRRFAAYARRS
jgi:nitrogenase iron protein NifH